MAQDAREQLSILACDAGATSRDLACTLVVAVVAADVATFFQVGDGAIVVSPRDETDEFTWVFWPERGEYANETVFLTDDRFAEHLVHDVTRGALDEVAVFTDGIQGLVLDYRERVVNAGFFRAMLAPLRASVDVGRLPGLSSALDIYLASARVNERTDDDKTLILSTRRAE